MSPASQPSDRVTEILAEGREPQPLELPATLAAGRYGVSRQAIIGVALVVALAVTMLGGRYLLARGDAAPQPVTMGAGSSPGAPSTDTLPEASSTTAATTAATATRVTVHVVGEVERPGVVTLPSGSRVDDALELAGGATSGADLSGVNLARPLVDGEQVIVPAPGESIAGAPMVAGGPAGVSRPGGSDALVNLNTADLTILETLPGVGPVLAQRILDWRAEHGQFAAVEELGEVSGVGDKTLAQLLPKVTV